MQGEPSGGREEEVRRLEVAVDDAGGVRLGDRVARLQDVERGLVRRGARPGA